MLEYTKKKKKKKKKKRKKKKKEESAFIDAQTHVQIRNIIYLRVPE